MAATNEAEPREENTQVKFRFCKNCANLLYPTEDKHSNSLMFQCRHCNMSENADTACVFRNDLTNAVGSLASICHQCFAPIYYESRDDMLGEGKFRALQLLASIVERQNRSKKSTNSAQQTMS